MEDWESCQRTWERFSLLQRDDVVPYNLLTRLHLYRRDFDAAIATARASLALENDQPDEKLKLARALFWSGRFAEGKALSESLAGQNPDHLEIQRFWGELPHAVRGLHPSVASMGTCYRS